MKIIGLTGSIGMGKSTAVGMLRRLGLPVFDADAAVHRLLGPGGKAVKPVAERFPKAAPKTPDAGVDRQVLGAAVFGAPAELKALEAILHPMVRAERCAFLKRQRTYRYPTVILDIPLLFETAGEDRCDAVFVVSAPAFLQRQRVLRRPGMTRERLDAILDKQLPDREKRVRADHIIPSGLGRAVTFRCLRRALNATIQQTDQAVQRSKTRRIRRRTLYRRCIK